MGIHASFVENGCWEAIIEVLPLGVVLTWDTNGVLMVFVRCGGVSFSSADGARNSKTEQK
jgi:hypothetical protein